VNDEGRIWKMITWIQGVLIACDGNIKGQVGDWDTWDGITALHLFNEIEHVHGRLWTETRSREDLEKAREKSLQQPHVLLWNSFFIRELAWSVVPDSRG
jgi:hypothetical protein